MSIKDWPQLERPREKLLQLGASHLSDAELLAILIQTGIKGKTAIDLAREALCYFGGLRNLLNVNCQTFCEYRGLGEAKYVLLHAALEISNRYLEQALLKQDILNNSLMTKRFLSLKLRDCPNEIFACLFLDGLHRVICYEELFEGTIHTAHVYAREIVRRALFHNAAAVVFAHNHPSGDPQPSEPDLVLTRSLKQMLAMLDIRLFDHIIIGDGETVSLAEKNWL